MPKRSSEFDAYIAAAAPFARPILKRIRKAYHEACPEIEEVMKWSFPNFEYKGMVGSMSAFKQHVGFGFWKAKLMKDPHRLFQSESSMGGVKISSVEELPPQEVLVEYIREAVRLNEEGKKIARPAKKAAEPVDIPDDLAKALRANRAARTAFEAFSPSHRREYVSWITEAKQQATRERRIATAIEWLSEGKPRNWKYMKPEKA